MDTAKYYKKAPKNGLKKDTESLMSLETERRRSGLVLIFFDISFMIMKYKNMLKGNFMKELQSLTDIQNSINNELKQLETLENEFNDDSKS